MPYQIRIRRDSTNNWIQNNPILGLGELGFDTETNEIRVGDGLNTWTDLPQLQASANAVSILGNAINSTGTLTAGTVLVYNSSSNQWEYGPINAVQIQGRPVVNAAAVPNTNDVIQWNGTEWVYAPMTGGPGGSGVTSVGLTMPSAIFDVTPATITSSGTFSVTLDDQLGNRVFAGPTSGALSAPPTFRALVAADLPDLSTLYQPLDSVLTSIDSATTLDSSANKIFYTTGNKTVALASLSSFARTLIDDADAATSRSTLGLGAITVGSTANTFDAIAWDTTPATTIAEAKLQWNTDYSTLELGLDANVTCKIGQGLYKLCHNNTGVDINKGDVVYISGSLGTTLLTVAKAQADAESTSATTVGVAAETFSNNTAGFIQVFGFLDGLTTNAITNSPAAGAALYLSEATAGALRGGLPTQPNHGVRVGFLVKVAGGNGGSIFVNVQNYQELEELSDVYIPTTPAGNDMLVWDSGDSRWENRTTAQVLSNIGAAASSHTHGGISNAGAIGTTSGLPIKTGTSGVLEVGAFGTSAGQFAEGNHLHGNISNDGKIGTTAGKVIVTTSGGTLDALADGSPNYVLSTNGSGTLSWVAQSGGSGTPGGTDTQVQFNDGGSTFGGDSGLTYNKTTDMLTVVGGITINATNELRLADTDSSHYVGFKSPGTVAANKVWTLPSTDGTNGQVLSTNGSGTLSWATAGTGSGTKTYAVFTPLQAQPPATDFATLDTRNNIAVLEFDGGSTDESTTFVGIMSEAASLGSGLKVRIHWMADTATSGDVRWGVAFERMNTDLDSDSFDTVAEANGTANGTSGIPTVTEITITTIDSMVAGDAFRLKVYREASDTTNDTMSGDAQLVAIEVRSAA